ncbi:spore germination protein GerPE [Aquibacillus sediminis]|uniref:spore germination protein GerPE n=1 Tax=Aquibacillus sediminis TaxID=2574734 RepID=UPI001108AD4F|nr:spore germination protein GerPE [Aquibacillus sediminis]
MKKRTAHTNKIRINSLSYSSVFDIGDVHEFTPVTKAIAVQKEGGVETDEGFEFSNFDFFHRQLQSLEQTKQLNQQTIHHTPHIHVNAVNVTGVSSSSIVQIGSLNTINAEARIKHIRILKEEQNETNEI